MIAASTFLLFVAISLGVTWWASRRTRSTGDFYAAGGRITPLQNGLAIAGDAISASTFLGFAGLVYIGGFDAVIYVLSAMAGLTVLLILVAEPFRNMGRYTFPDMAAWRLDAKPIRTMAAVSTLVVVVLYLVAQMVAAGALIQLLFDLSYLHAVIIIGTLMTIYVAGGGMLATTWVQIIKAVLMIVGILVLSAGTLYYFDFSIDRLYRSAAEVHRLGAGVLAPGGLFADPVSTIGLALALFFGTIGLPHVLMRLYTVRDAQAAYRSVFYASLCMGLVFVLIVFVVGFGAIALLHGHPEFFDADGQLIGGSNMATIHLSRIVAGDVFQGFISGVVFATIVAVVAGLTITGAATLSHDLYANVLKDGGAGETRELFVSRVASICLGIIAVLLAVFFEGQNIAYMISMVFVVTASASCPILLLAIYWRGLTTRGALIGGTAGLVLAVGGVILGPTVWVDILGNETPVFPWRYPGAFSVSTGFFLTWLGSVLDRSPRGAAERARFDSAFIEMHRGSAA